jgi:MFS family permease
MPSFLLALIYLVFVSLGLPDALLGSAWPVMYEDLGARVGAQSFITIVITACTIVASLNTAKLMHKVGTGKLVARSVGLTAVSILAFSLCRHLWQLLLVAVPYGLGAGVVDTALNNYVAVHYGERHMNWLHACWGIGTSVSPVIMGRALAGSLSWQGGYLVVGIIQVIITLVVVLSLPMWKATESGAHGLADFEETPAKSLRYREALALPGAKTAINSFACYSSFEGICALWTTSYLVMARDVSEANAATMLSLFYMGITVGRLFSGFVAPHVGNQGMIRRGQVVVAVGLVCLLFGEGFYVLCAALVLIGLGCAPICPCFISLTPERFGDDISQTMVSLQMACGYIGAAVMLPVCSLIAFLGWSAFIPVFLALILAGMVHFDKKTNRILSRRS